ncbi:MAG: hypothetical protein KDK56_08655 [Simkania sp.]|nr:hypothetical protein [Simkania sp.]MCB1074004.1 hypothetical protein [Simkania sp.]MCP5490438.1 hypothetical protein [Chlamydiales bacterium]
MFHSITANVDKIYDHFQDLTAKCFVSNIVFASFIREVRWMPALVTSVTFAFSSSVANYAAADFTEHWIPETFRDDPTYYETHRYLHGVYFASFFALSLIGATVLTQCALPLFGREAPIAYTFFLATLDLLPFYYHEIVKLFKRVTES